jgi:ABC-type multidrug transport system fused ATPase/permease subunit
MKQFQDKTIIIIAHRLSTILSSEKVAVIKDGVLVGYDKHSVLLNICDEYYKLFHSQYFL